MGRRATGPVLVLSNRDDLTADMVIHELNQRDVPVARLDPADFPDDLTLAARLDNRLWSGPVASAGGRNIRLEEVRAVYYRRPGLPVFADTMTEAAREWSLREAIHGVYGVLGALDCLYVNHPAHNYAAEFKPGQLAAAARCGLAVPRTLVTNDPDEARAFAKETKAVLKPIRGGSLVEDGQRKAAYTAFVAADDIDDSLRLTAHLLQAWVAKKHDVRLVVVGQRMFAAEIHAGSDAALVDFRADYDSLRYRPAEVPAAVRAGVRSLMDRLCLVFSALDFAVDEDGRWIFLGDLNPNGQLGWIEGYLPELRITAAIADVLQQGHS